MHITSQVKYDWDKNDKKYPVILTFSEVLLRVVVVIDLVGGVKWFTAKLVLVTWKVHEKCGWHILKREGLYSTAFCVRLLCTTFILLNFTDSLGGASTDSVSLKEI